MILKVSIELLLNFVDTPGHPEFVAQIAADLQITDGLVLVMDCDEGLCTHTEPILKRALVSENVKPILFINKIDTLFADNIDLRRVNEVAFRRQAKGRHLHQLCRHWKVRFIPSTIF